MLHETGHKLADWQVAKRTASAVNACRLFVYLARKITPGVPIPQLAELAIWSEDSTRRAIKAARDDQQLKSLADAIASEMAEHTQ